MSKYIFQSKTCLKSEIYNTIKEIMIAAGWQNITSSYASDSDVMYSTGEDDTQDLALYVNIKPSRTSDEANSIELTDYNVASYRFPEAYTPGDVGSPGTFTRTISSEPWKYMYIAPTASTISKSVTVTIKYHCNKNRIIFAIIYPDASGIAPMITYIGIPDEIYVNTTGSKDMLFATSSGGVSNSSVQISDDVMSMPRRAYSSARNTYVQLPPKQVNADGKVIMSEIFYGSTSEGLRGKLTGIYAISPSATVLNSGNIITIGSDQYLVLVCGSLSYNSFQTLYLAIQIS